MSKVFPIMQWREPTLERWGREAGAIKRLLIKKREGG